MDKQKQIEEMARDVANAGKVASEWLCEETKRILREKGNFKSTEHTKTLSDIVAEELAKMGYRKIPDYDERLCDIADEICKEITEEK